MQIAESNDNAGGFFQDCKPVWMIGAEQSP